MHALTTGKLAAIFGTAPRTVTLWIDRGLLRGYQLPGSRARRVQLPDALAFARRHELPLDELVELLRATGETLPPAMTSVLLVSPDVSLLRPLVDAHFDAAQQAHILYAATAYSLRRFDLVMIDSAIGRGEVLLFADWLRSYDRSRQVAVAVLTGEDGGDWRTDGLRTWRKPCDVGRVAAEALRPVALTPKRRAV